MTAAGMTVPEMEADDDDGDDEMRESELDVSDRGDGGVSDEEDERDRSTDEDMDDDWAPKRPTQRRGHGDGGGRQPRGRAERPNDDVFRTVAAMMNGQQAARYGLDLDSAAALTDYGELKGGQKPTMGRMMAESEALPATGALY